MNVITSSKLQHALKNTQKLFIWGTIFIIVAVCFGIWAFNVHFKEVEPITMNSAIINKKGTDTYAKIDVTSSPYVFAEYEDTSNKYYFVFDKNNLMYIVYLSDYDYKFLKENATNDNPIVITGMTRAITDDMRNLAIKIYNEASEEEFLTEKNFEDYLGSIYLDTLEYPNDNTLQIVFTIIFVILGIGFIIVGFFRKNKTNKKIQSFSESEWKNIEMELEDDNTISYDSLKLYFTNNYIINLESGIDIFSYNDILWMYPFLIKQYGITTNKSIILVTTDKEKHKISNVSNFSKKSRKNYDDIINFIFDKNKKIIIGYTKENIRQMKDLYGIK